MCRFTTVTPACSPCLIIYPPRHLLACVTRLIILDPESQSHCQLAPSPFRVRTPQTHLSSNRSSKYLWHYCLRLARSWLCRQVVSTLLSCTSPLTRTCLSVCEVAASNDQHSRIFCSFRVNADPPGSPWFTTLPGVPAVPSLLPSFFAQSTTDKICGTPFSGHTFCTFSGLVLTLFPHQSHAQVRP